MQSKAVLAVTLATVLIFNVTASALAQEDLFSARVLAKGKKSVIMILLVNSSKSTHSIHDFEITFTEGKPIVAIARGWEGDRNGNTMTFTATRSDLGPGGRAILIIKVSDPASSAFEWSVNDNNGNLLQSGQVTKIKIREPPKDVVLPQPSKPEVNVDEVKAFRGDQVKVNGKGYETNSQIKIYFDQVEVAAVITDDLGTFSTFFIIPNDVSIGLHLIRGVDATNKSSVIQFLVELPEGSLPPLEGGKLVVRTDREEYRPGDLIRLTGSAVLERSVSLQILDPKSAIVCGQNPAVNAESLLWDATCPLPRNAIDGRYLISAKQVPHTTTAVFTVKGSTSGSGEATNGEPGEDPGPLKLTTDKENYKVGDTTQVTVTGVRPNSILDYIIDGPKSQLDVKRVTSDKDGVVTFSYPLTGSDAVGVWVIIVKQMDAEQKNQYKVRKLITVES